MRLQTKHIDKLVTDAKVLQNDSIPALIKACEIWSRGVKYGYDQYSMIQYRNNLEKELKDFRLELAAIYDHMGERGLRENGS